MRPTLRLLASLALLAAAASTALAVPGEINGIDKIYLREGPGSEQAAIGILSAGDVVEIVDAEGSWTRVQTADGKIGYVYHRYVRPRTGEPASTGLQNPPPLSAAASPLSSPRPSAPAPQPPVAAVRPAPAAPADPPAAAAPSAPSPLPELSTELAALRAVLADLKQKIQERPTELSGEAAIPHGSTYPPPSEAPAGAIGAAESPGTAAATNDPLQQPSPAVLSARDTGIGVLMIALFSLVVGWVLGSTFGGGRRGGSRLGRGGRLRF